MTDKTEDKKKPVGRPLKFDDPKKLQDQIDAYYKSCFDYQRDMFGKRIKDQDEKGEPVYIMKQVKPYTVAGLAVFLDTSRQTLVEYEDYDHFPDTIDEDTKQALIDTVKRAKEHVYAFTEEMLFKPGVQTGAIFWLKNNAPDKWKDRHEIGGDQTVIVKSVKYTDEDSENADDTDNASV